MEITADGSTRHPCIVLIAGLGTIAQTLSWFFYLLSEHPDEEKQTRSELWSKLPELCEGRISTSSIEQTGELEYLEAALRETLRPHPLVPTNVKFTNRDVVLSDGALIPRDKSVNFSTYTLLRMKHVWGDDVKGFKLQRWIDLQSSKLVQVYTYEFSSLLADPHMLIGRCMRWLS